MSDEVLSKFIQHCREHDGDFEDDVSDALASRPGSFFAEVKQEPELLARAAALLARAPAARGRVARAHVRYRGRNRR